MRQDISIKRVYGKEIDVKKLKNSVLNDLNEHLRAVLATIEYLNANHDPIRQKTCYICNESDATIFTEIHGFTYVTCSYCGHLRTTKRFSEDAIHDFYRNNEYYSKTTYANNESCFYRKEHVAEPKVSFLEKYAEFADLKRKKWIDVGAGIGDLITVASEHGWDAIGLEISKSSVAFGKQIFNANLVLETLEGYLAQNPELYGKIDVISMMGYLEHTINPLEQLTLAQQALKKGGYLMVQVPSADSFSCKIQSVFPENVFRQMNPIDHIMLFSKKSLIKALSDTNFEPIALWFHGLDVYELLNNLVMLHKNIDETEFYKTFYHSLNELQYVFDKQEQSDRIICLARK